MYKIIIALILSSFFSANIYAQGLASNSIKNNKMDFLLSISSRCMFGDFDAIKYDMEYSNNSHLLVSLLGANGEEYSTEILEEMLIDSGAEPEIEQKNAQDFVNNLFTKGYPFSIKVPSDFSGSYNLVICKDSNGSKSCKNKNVGDISQILNAYKDRPQGYTPKDSIYFYQPVYVNKGSLNFSKEALGESNTAIFKRDLKVSDKSLVDIKTIGSFPLKNLNKMVAIDLPRYDVSKCGH